MPPDPGREVLDVVDAANRVIGHATRAEVHARGLLHRAVHMLVLNPAGDIYVQRRALDKDCQPGLWDTSAAGHVDRGEDWAAAARRELAEELALTGVALELLGELSASAATGNEFVRVYRCRSAREPRPDPHEIMDAGWWREAALADWMARRPDDFTAVFHTVMRLQRASRVA
ncbi:MAG: NUDIX domain-containing protein [Gammaproteobacteria bacterium]